ncbi:hypothetical protein [Rhodohalobacter mucosus]|uniref:hypothetical protein n=1 Tax=Rhodohalobacter mucosus TaxID=2079485 RepID=UPI001304B631|nr:hypothetical protein [Rhodohalobacter mucosus]
MSIPFLFSSGIIVVILVGIGLFFTFKEFGEMYDHPESYRLDRTSDPKIVSDDDDESL